MSLLLFRLVVCPAQAVFTSLCVFGDGICTTTNNEAPPEYAPYYYGKRFSNGRVWVEVLAQRQGLGANSISNVNWSYSSNNWSYYGHYSSDLLTNLNNFTAPADASNALFIIWCADADFVWNILNYGADMTQWTNAMNQSLSNHFTAVTNLYHAKGARTVLMPNAVDLTKVPRFSSATDKDFIRQRTIDFNATFATTLKRRIETNCPNIAIYIPDIFALLDDIVANSTNYGLIKPETYVFKDLPPAQWALDGPGTNYVFWDNLDPTAKAHAVFADVIQQFISPVRISKITPFTGSNRLDLINVPIGLNGFVDASTNFVNWTSQASFSSTNATQTIFIPASGPLEFYRLRFPFAWSWP